MIQHVIYVPAILARVAIKIPNIKMFLSSTTIMPPCFRMSLRLTEAPHDDIFRAERELGICRVLCFHPDHDLTLARMLPGTLSASWTAWVAQTQDLGRRPEINYVQIFENRGPMMGASNPHPHCQIWATEHIPDEPIAEQSAQLEYLDSHGSCMLCDTVARELQSAERIVCENQEFVAVVPFWAVWPFETLVLGRRHCGAFTEMNASQKAALAEILKQVTTRYDNLFQTSFPYTMGFHQSPTDSKSHPEWHFHAHFYPPLLRSATIRKFMVGFEMLGMPQRDITPEIAAERLRAVSDQHYTLKTIEEANELSSSSLALDGQPLTLEDLAAVAYGRTQVVLHSQARQRMDASRAVVDRYLAEGVTVYGINTGFGKMSEVSIPPDQLADLQLNLVRSHACGVGEPLAEGEIRGMLLLRANVLAKGTSGVRVVVAEHLLSMLEKNICPVVPARGSVGASGDLAPLAHLALGMIGEGEVFYQGKRMAAE